MSASLRIQAVQPPIIPIVAEMIRNCPGTIPLGQGVVHYGPPPEAVARMQEFFHEPENHKYKPVHGIPPLLQAIESKLWRENGIRIEAGSSIVVTAGSNMAFMNAVLAITDPGDEIILPTPYYFNHEMAITMANCKPVLVPTDANHQLQPEVIASAITDKTRAIVTISPNNPSGAVYPQSDLCAVNDLCRRHGLYHISDEAYEYFTFDGATHFSPASGASSQGHTISLFSLSKAYGFASWRIGYMVLPEHLLASVKKIQDTLLICPPVISQHAAVGALEAGAEYCRSKLRGIAEVREIALREFQTIREICDVPSADGAFYFLLKVRRPADPMRLVEELIRKHGVAVIPGTAFGINDHCLLRASYGALEPKTAVEGIRRLTRGLQAIFRP